MALIIREINNEYEECTAVIRNSFITVADEFGLTRENAPTNPAFAGADSLLNMKEKGLKLFGAYLEGLCVGFVAIEKAQEGCFYMERLAVLPEYRHNGYGRELMDFVFRHVGQCGGAMVSIALINNNKRLKDWYGNYGFTETGIKTFKHLPFDVCFMQKSV